LYAPDESDHWWWKLAVLVAVLAIVFAVVWAATGFSSGILFAIAIGAGTAVAIFRDTRGVCMPRFLRRRD
jgi:hypothetical protein